MLQLCFEPMACSLAIGISLYEPGATAKFHGADLTSSPREDGSDFPVIGAMGQIPVLRTHDRCRITENAAILLKVAEAHSESGLAPRMHVKAYFSRIREHVSVNRAFSAELAIYSCERARLGVA